VSCSTKYQRSPRHARTFAVRQHRGSPKPRVSEVLPLLHNGKIHRDFWLEDWEKEKIVEYYRANATEGYRAVAYRMMDEDVVAVAPSTTSWRCSMGAAAISSTGTSESR
jgi:hypothetical protein